MKQHRTDYDLMRIIACNLVIFNHMDGYSSFQQTSPGWKTWICMVPAMITRINVPLFFMIGGALLLNDRVETYQEIMGVKRPFDEKVIVSELLREMKLEQTD